ncbi:HET-domain-containing protein [Xylariaceae sp. FL0255]|nr:HET-domain-containing protein [Xylariaceae sp. FL0255]
MRLLNTLTHEIESFNVPPIPPYAILSHTWDTDELTLQEWLSGDTKDKMSSESKIMCACWQARLDGLSYLWADMICIDKTSSTELSEAINSMFLWYRKSTRCYVYLTDVVLPSDAGPSKALSVASDLKESRSFTRGWTLQELLAPRKVLFFDHNWELIGDKEDEDMLDLLSAITGIYPKFLTGRSEITDASVSERMSWMSYRQTSREEDIAYAMLGIFEINMPLLYGEGTAAFIRLQEEIIRISNDQTVFCWSYGGSIKPDEWDNILAPHPYAFRFGARFKSEYSEFSGGTDYTLTNNGLSIKLPMANYVPRSTSLLVGLAVREAGWPVMLLLSPSSRRGLHTRSRLAIDPLATSKYQFTSQGKTQGSIASETTQFRLKYRGLPARNDRPNAIGNNLGSPKALLHVILGGNAVFRQSVVTKQPNLIYCNVYDKGAFIALHFELIIGAIGAVGAVVLEVQRPAPSDDESPRYNVVLAYRAWKGGLEWYSEMIPTSSVKNIEEAVRVTCVELQRVDIKKEPVRVRPLIPGCSILPQLGGGPGPCQQAFILFSRNENTWLSGHREKRAYSNEGLLVRPPDNSIRGKATKLLTSALKRQ